ncbi:MAG: metal ABC transporter permease [Thermomicrobiales bacterium]|nr:metal ABC transporter permease [Thermomicrobiales bacterium]MCO5225576.1 metal ABC transporter permease [Thermomicrobiales bacterium]MCO5227220.1 metal ABC transporter permease [Thermomicrobiales bacterium]
MSTLHDLIFDYTLRNVALGGMLLGIVAGVLGAFAVLRRQALLGDTLSHAALPGICIAFMITGSRESLVLLIGAGIAGWIGTWILLRTVNATKLSEDTMLGVVLSVFFGVGILLLTYIQQTNNANQAGLDKYLFGQAASLIAKDVATFAILGIASLSAVFVFYKEFKLLSFDPEFLASLGLPVRRLDLALTSLLVVAVMIGLQTVGVVLMAAMVIGPGTAARQWTDNLRTMLVLSGLFGGLAGLIGAVVSVQANRLPTGPSIILALTVIVMASILFAPEHGIIADWWRSRTRRESFKRALESGERP